MDVRYVKGIGPKKAEILEKMGINSTLKSLYYFPRDYEDRTKILNLDQIDEGVNACYRLTVATAPKTTRVKGSNTVTNMRAYDDTGTCEIVYFNNKYVANNLSVGGEYIFYGKAMMTGKRIVFTNPIFESMNAIGNNTLKIQPIYPLSSGISNKDIQKVVSFALENPESRISDYLSEELLKKYDLMELSKALYEIHKPSSIDMAINARRRMIFDELLLLSCGLSELKNRRKDVSGLEFYNLMLDDFYGILPFELTNAQKNVINDIIMDLRQGKMLNRIVQGDVGSGKTMIAAALSVIAFKNEFQSAIMAPTEILATQHFEGLSKLLGKIGIQCVLLTGGMPAKLRRETLAKIADGTANVIIGTHALITEDVVYKNLGAVIADEQHRFGVNARATLCEKAKAPHVLVMSATPIPRSLALILHGDLDLSVIDELPPNRIPIETYAVSKDKHQRIYEFIRKHVKNGRQAYIVCPMIEENAEYDDSLYDVESYHARLQTEIFPEFTVKSLHGRTNKKEKAQTMAEFSQGKVDILVTTTVIEVGVNVPNAAIMVIEDGQRFGLSGLHQLRGRVGRGEYQSYCIVFGVDKGQKAKDRLKIFASTSDGFKIASEDLKIRGPGDFFGTKQHGLPTLKIADLASDMEIMYLAQSVASDIMEENNGFENYPYIKMKLDELLKEQNIFN